MREVSVPSLSALTGFIAERFCRSHSTVDFASFGATGQRCGLGFVGCSLMVLPADGGL